MFYLTKTQGIIDSDKQEVFFSSLKGKPYISVDNKNFTEVIDSSDEIFDLIEVGDLLIYESGGIVATVGLVTKVYYQNNLLVVMDDDKRVNSDSIYQIFKLNGEGNYIKVWDKKKK